MRTLHHTLTAALSLTLLACGGGGDADTSTVLGTSTAALTLAASGTARMISVTNKGLTPAKNLRFGATDMPPGTAVRSSCPASLLPGASCLLVVTPGNRPTAMPGDPEPLSALVEVAGDNTNTLKLVLWVISYGSVHQGGYVFALDDSTALTLGVGGKVLTTNDLAGGSSWSQTLEAIPGVSDNSVAGPGSCDGALDGRCNTARILSHYPSGSRDFAAARCADHRGDGFSDWYLPALCELGYGGLDPSDPEQALCGTQTNPRLPDNVSTRLTFPGGLGPFNPNPRWSSTQRSRDATNDAGVSFSFGPQSFVTKTLPGVPLRCARHLTP